MSAQATQQAGYPDEREWSERRVTLGCEDCRQRNPEGVALSSTFALFRGRRPLRACSVERMILHYPATPPLLPLFPYILGWTLKSKLCRIIGSTEQARQGPQKCESRT
jgi:hypothetical protein